MATAAAAAVSVHRPGGLFDRLAIISRVLQFDAQTRSCSAESWVDNFRAVFILGGIPEIDAYSWWVYRGEEDQSVVLPTIFCPLTSQLERERKPLSTPSTRTFQFAIRIDSIRFVM